MPEPKQVINAWAETERDTRIGIRREQRIDEREGVREKCSRRRCRGRKGGPRAAKESDKCITSLYAQIICSVASFPSKVG